MHVKKAEAAADKIIETLSHATAVLRTNIPSSELRKDVGTIVRVELDLHIGRHKAELITHDNLPEDFFAGLPNKTLQAEFSIEDLSKLDPTIAHRAILRAISQKVKEVPLSDIWIALEDEQTQSDRQLLVDEIAECLELPEALPLLQVKIGAKFGTFSGIFFTDLSNQSVALEDVFPQTAIQEIVSRAEAVFVADSGSKKPQSTRPKTKQSEGDRMMDFFK